MIDAHVHFWNYNKIKDAWITDDMKLLQRDFLPQDLQNALSKNNVEGVVAVQADQSENETDFLLALAKENQFIKGVVGWLDLQNENIENKLLYYSKEPLIKGFRHIVQAEPEGFLQNENFLNGIRALEPFDFTYDILIYENQLNEAVRFIDKYPTQKFIIDHCAKPQIRNKNADDGVSAGWKKAMKEIAQHENVFCKLSGLITEAKWNEWDENDIFPYLDIVFEYFGTRRLVFGSDWPVVLLSGTYSKWKNLVENYMLQFSTEEKEKVFKQNAIQFYNLNV